MPAQATKKDRDLSPGLDVREVFETTVGCKWTLHVLAAIRDGTTRPGAILRTAEGLSQKVLQQRLKKLCGYGILARTEFPTVPPRVEYRLTDFGRRVTAILDQIDALARDPASAAAVNAGVAGEPR